MCENNKGTAAGKLQKEQPTSAMSPLAYINDNKNFSSTQETNQQRRCGNDEEAVLSSQVHPPSYDKAVSCEEEAPDCVMKKNDGEISKTTLLNFN